ncbi:MAG: sulfite exporter TauE/SafE family protein [Deltaproteobacteria bacterium]
MSHPSPWAMLGLTLAALAAGAVNSIAGGGMLITFPALLSVGLDAIGANATSTLALIPGALGATFGYRRSLRGDRARILAIAAPSLVGGGLGALLVVALGNARFERLAPWLVLLGTLLFLGHGLLSRSRPSRVKPGPLLALSAGQLVIAIYGGFFGAGMGILMLALYGAFGLTDIHEMNGLKNVAAGLINGAAAVYFALHGKVVWPLAGLMAVGTVLGGLGGARLAQRVGQSWVRGAVGALGLGFTAYLLWRQLRG